jgi:hypothetical protein
MRYPAWIFLALLVIGLVVGHYALTHGALPMGHVFTTGTSGNPNDTSPGWPPI